MGINPSALAYRMGMKNRSTVNRWMRGLRRLFADEWLKAMFAGGHLTFDENGIVVRINLSTVELVAMDEMTKGIRESGVLPPEVEKLLRQTLRKHKLVEKKKSKRPNQKGNPDALRRWREKNAAR